MNNAITNEEQEENLPGIYVKREKQVTETSFFPVSEGKLMTMYILSFGFYGIYWFYKNWKLQQKTMDKKIYPLLRAIFAIFFAHSLFRRIKQQAVHLDKKHKFFPNIYATLFLVTIITSNILDHLTVNLKTQVSISNSDIIAASLLLFVISVYPLLKAQAIINRINDDVLGYLNYKYSLLNYILIFTGAAVWLLIGLGLLLDYMGIATTA
jgi:hypothetical protein